MAEFKGEIAFLDERTFKSKRPPYKPYTVYSVKLTLDSGELSPKIDAGYDKPQFNKGDYVAITTTQDGKGYEKITSIVPAARPAPSAPAAGSSAGPAQGANAVDGDGAGADRQTQIVLQHSQEMALQAIALLIDNDALPLSAATNKAGATKRYEEIRKAVQKLTVEFFFDVVTGRLLESVADAGEVVVEDVGELPAAANDAKVAAATGTDD